MKIKNAEVKLSLGHDPGPENKIIVDGEEINNVTSIDLHVGVDEIPWITIKKWALGPIEIKVSKATVDVIEEAPK